MTASTRVARLPPDGEIRLSGEPLPPPADNCVRVEIAYAGIRGSDLHPTDRVLSLPVNGIAMGHELSGIVAAAAPGGTVVVVGLPPAAARAALCPWHVVERELTIRDADGIEGAFPRVVALLERIVVDEIITDVHPLAEVAVAFEAARVGASGKVLLQVVG